jgi:lipopolysaccharide heptosyltransferase II
VTAPGWTAVRRVLAIRLDALGDVILTSPALRALRDSEPARRITLLTSPSGAAAAALLPSVDEVIVYEAPWLKATPARPDASHEHAMAARLAGERFDAAVIFTVYSQSPLPSALLCYLAGIPRRLAHCHENPYQLLTDWIPDPDPAQGIRHEVRRQLDLVAAVGCTTADERLALRLPPGAVERAAALLDQLGLDGTRPWAVVHAGSTAPSRRYASDRFAAVVRGLARAGVEVVFTGSAEEADLVAGIRRAAGVEAASLAGCLDLGELAALLARAPVLVSNNTGPVHVAAAMGTPVVDLYALTNPQHTPWGVPHRVLSHDVPCKYCYKSVCPVGHHQCLDAVEPESVVAAALDLLVQRAAT